MQLSKEPVFKNQQYQTLYTFSVNEESIYLIILSAGPFP